MYVPVSITKCW